MRPLSRELFAYATVGSLTALLYLAVALIATVNFGVSPRWASLCGFVVALPFSYFGHKLFTFRSSGQHQDELPRFVAAAGAALLISASVPEFVVRDWGASPLAGYLAACVGVPALNYLLLRLWVFVGRGLPISHAIPPTTDIS